MRRRRVEQRRGAPVRMARRLLREWELAGMMMGCPNNNDDATPPDEDVRTYVCLAENTATRMILPTRGGVWDWGRPPIASPIKVAGGAG